MDISWNEAVDRLSSVQEVTVNAREVYPKVLNNNGFVHHAPLVRGGRHLDGKSFCEEMNKIYHNGERIFAHVGRLHVAAIVPTENSDGTSSYKIIDSWDSSKRLIGEYWVRQAKKPTQVPTIESQRLLPRRILNVGKRLRHPTFGEGTIIVVSPGILTIDFGVNGSRRLGEDWVLKHCSIIDIQVDEPMNR